MEHQPLDKAFPPKGYESLPSQVEGILVYGPASLPDPEKQTVVDFQCPQCGGATAYNAQEGGLTCTFCSYHEPPVKKIVGKGAEQMEFTMDTMQQAAHGWGLSRQELSCMQCGAQTILPENQLSHSCPFCHSNQVSQQKAEQDVLRPRFLVPLTIERESIIQPLKQWMGENWMLPDDLVSVVGQVQFSPIYLPFWTMDAEAKASWKAEVGHQETETYWEDGQMRTRTKTVWKWESGSVHKHFDDVLINGSTHIHEGLVEKVADFDLEEMVPYEAHFLAGVSAQAYEVNLEQAWKSARSKMRQKTKLSCLGQTSTNQVRNFSMNLSFDQEAWRYILLPFLLASYQYEGKSYQILFNGQNKKFAGERPIDWKKIRMRAFYFFIPGIIGLMTALGLGLSSYNGTEIHSLAASIGGGLSLIAGIISIVLFSKGRKLEKI